MATDGFKIDVPITLKGGREGERVGKQIGEKIASQLRKSLSVVGFGAQKGGGAGALGMAKGLKGVASKLGLVAAAVTAVLGVLSKASPYLKGILSIFGRAFMIFFRPFGDFLATLLRPMAILLMKMAVAFMKWLRPFQGSAREAMENAPQIKEVDNALANFAIGIANWAIQIGAAIGDFIVNIGIGAFDLGVKIGDWFYEAVIVPVADFIKSKLASLFGGGKSVGGVITSEGLQTQGITSPGGAVSGGGIREIINAPGFTPKNVLENLPNISKGKSGMGGSLLGSIFPGGGSLLGSLGNLLGFANGGTVPGAIGKPQLAVVHGGEEVISNGGRGKSTVINQTLNFSGDISSDMDIDAIARNASRAMEMELKKRGAI